MMSLHTIPEHNTEEIKEALSKAGFYHDRPSQTADAFRLGWQAAHAAGVREGIEKATTPTDAMKAHFEGDNEIYQTFEIDGETHILPLRFATVRYVLDEIRALIKE